MKAQRRLLRCAQVERSHAARPAFVCVVVVVWVCVWASLHIFVTTPPCCPTLLHGWPPTPPVLGYGHALPHCPQRPKVDLSHRDALGQRIVQPCCDSPPWIDHNAVPVALALLVVPPRLRRRHHPAPVDERVWGAGNMLGGRETYWEGTPPLLQRDEQATSPQQGLPLNRGTRVARTCTARPPTARAAEAPAARHSLRFDRPRPQQHLPMRLARGDGEGRRHQQYLPQGMHSI